MTPVSLDPSRSRPHREHVPLDEPTRLPRWARTACAGLDLDDLCDRVVEADLSAAFDELRDHTDFVLGLRASVEENLGHLQRVLVGQASIDAVLLVAPVAFAGLQARLRLPQTATQRSYRVGFIAMWEAWSRRLVEQAAEQEVPRAEGLEALRDMTTLLLRYQDHVASQVAETFALADEELSRSREHVRNGLVRHLLREDAPPLTSADLVLLDYPLDADHVAVLLPELSESAARSLLARLRDVARTRDTLVHPIDLASTVVWLAQPRTPGWRPGAVERVLACLRAHDVRASVSQPLIGVTGLRRGWAQVHEVEGVRVAWGSTSAPRQLSHADVSLEILLMADLDRARAFVRAELGALGTDEPLAVRLRETVEASHRHGSHVVTAEHLHLHEHTVRNRLQKATELLGRPLTERRTELQVALRISRLLARAEG